jgi:hypothetical protein
MESFAYRIAVLQHEHNDSKSQHVAAMSAVAAPAVSQAVHEDAQHHSEIIHALDLVSTRLDAISRRHAESLLVGIGLSLESGNVDSGASETTDGMLMLIPELFHEYVFAPVKPDGGLFPFVSPLPPFYAFHCHVP